MKRKLKIEEKGTQYARSKRVPYVRLKGKWLEAAGFPSGKQIELTVIAPGYIEIRVITEDKNI